MFVKKYTLQLSLCIHHLAPLIRAADEQNDTSKQYLVDPTQIPGLEKIEDLDIIPEMYAGHISMFDDIKENTENKDKVPSDFGYFFWKFEGKLVTEEEENDEEKPLIFWFNGGPGCSSMDGALVESGPFRINNNGEAIINPGSWHTRGDLVFIDQPIGTGFSSFNDENIDLFFENDLNQVSERLMEFLKNYFQIFPADQDKEIILAGESYAGQYIPYFASHIKTYNNNNKDGKSYNLKSLLIGNGWIDPTTQSLSYLPFAMENGLVDRKSPSFDELLKQHESCQNKINSAIDNKVTSKFEFPECERIIQKLLAITSDEKEQDCINVYNYDLKDSYPACGMNWPDDISNVGKFFSNKKVQKALHINKDWETNWNECRLEVDKNLFNKNIKQSIELLPDLLQDGIETILFNGDKDLICNNKGVLDSIDNMNWGGSRGFSDDVKDYDWIYRNQHLGQDENVGFIKYDKNLTFISVYNASHMVPFDKGMVSRGIVDIAMDHVLLSTVNEKHALISGELPFFEDEADDDSKKKNNNEDKEEDNREEDNKDNSDNEGDDSDDSDNEYDSDDEEDGEEESDDDEEDEEDEEEEDEKDKKEPFKSGIVILFCFIISALYGGVKYRKAILSKLFGTSYEKVNGQKKTVTWADDLENDATFEDGTDSQLNIHDDDEIPPALGSSDVDDANLFELEDMKR
ncbi:pheromone-processing carboxypeptidase Kex1p [Monosporozyma servazzii]